MIEARTRRVEGSNEEAGAEGLGVSVSVGASIPGVAEGVVVGVVIGAIGAITGANAGGGLIGVAIQWKSIGFVLVQV